MHNFLLLSACRQSGKEKVHKKTFQVAIATPYLSYTPVSCQFKRDLINT